MKANSKVKTVVATAILLIVFLLIISVWQLILINKKQKQLNAQQIEINRLNDTLNYYKNHQPSSGGNEIIEGGEE